MKQDEENQKNILLKSKIIINGGNMELSDELPLEVENEFLENVITYEKAPEKPIYQIIGVNPDDFPPSEKPSDEEILQKLKLLIPLLQEHSIFPEYKEGVPDRLVYQALQEELTEVITVLPFGAWHLDGCDGWCPGCFQADYCRSKDETWSKEEFEEEREKYLESKAKNKKKK